MQKTIRYLLAMIFSVSVFVIPFPVSAAYNQNLAESYLSAHPDNPWSTMGLSLLGADSIPLDHLKSVSGDSAIEFAAPILAITSLDEDPRTFGDKDLIAKLESYHAESQLGDDSTVNDDIFGLLALVSADVDDQVTSDARNFVIDNQQSNGGWGFQTSGGTDSNMTAAAIVALIASDVAESSDIIQNALNYLKTTQNDDGGFTYDPESPWGTDSDSSSTAWVIWALNAANEDIANWMKDVNSPISYLESNQDTIGFFQYQNGFSEDSFSATTTAYAVIALAGETLPLNIYKIPEPARHHSGGNNNDENITPNIITDAAPLGQVLSAIAYAEGTLVKTGDNPTVYIVKNGKFQPFSSEKMFFAHGLKFSDVQIVNSSIITPDNLGSIIGYPDGSFDVNTVQ